MVSVKRVVIATDDGINVKIGHFGDAKLYIIYEVSKDGIKEINRLENPFKGEEEEHVHGVLRKRIKLLEYLGKVDIVISTFFGPGGEDFFRKKGVTPIKVKPKTKIKKVLEEIVSKYID